MKKKNDLNVTNQQLLNGITKPSADSDLQTKLDYLIYLLESQNEQKTDNVLEELILYSFLGIFTNFYCRFICKSRKIYSLIDIKKKNIYILNGKSKHKHQHQDLPKTK